MGEFSIFKSSRILTNLKIKYAEIDFTSHHSFLRLKKVKKINFKLPHTKKTQCSPYEKILVLHLKNS
jgi:hypothetical protein